MEEDGFIDCSLILQPAVYALVHKDIIVYVGKTIMPAQRISGHRSEKHKQFASTAFGNKSIKGIPFDKVYLLPCSKADLDELEKRFIRKYKPKYNMRHKGPDDYVSGSIHELVKHLIPADIQESVAPIRRRA